MASQCPVPGLPPRSPLAPDDRQVESRGEVVQQTVVQGRVDQLPVRLEEVDPLVLAVFARGLVVQEAVTVDLFLPSYRPQVGGCLALHLLDYRDLHLSRCLRQCRIPSPPIQPQPRFQYLSRYRKPRRTDQSHPWSPDSLR